MTTDGTGAVTWTDRTTFVDDNQNLTLAGNTLNIDNGTAANLSNLNAAGDVTGTLSTLAIQPDAVNSSKILDGSVVPADIATGGNNKVLTTDGTGAVNWADRSTFTDDNQNLGFSGNTLTIDNGTAVNLSASGQVTGLLDNLVIQPGASNQVMTTNAAGTATVWTTPGGDITGPVNTTTVGRIQGRNVSNTAPNSGEALIWNGAAWVPGNVAVAIAPTTQFYAVDPALFSHWSHRTVRARLVSLHQVEDLMFLRREIQDRSWLREFSSWCNYTIGYSFYEYTTLLGLLPLYCKF